MCLQNEEAGVSDPNKNGMIDYRPFTSDDIAAGHALSTAVRWRHRPDDWRFAARLGQGFVAQDASGVIGTALAWRFGREAATLGMMIVAPEHQRRGVGRKLLELLIDELGPRTLLIHASPAGESLCKQLGFRSIGKIHQHQGAAFQPPLVSLPPGERLRPLGVNDAPRLVELASRASGLDRSELLPALLDIASGIALDRDGELIGFALFRRFGDGHVIGPVVAPGSPDASRAKALISHWLALNAGMFVRIDTPAESGLSSWLEGLGLPHVDSIEKMMRNGPLPADPQLKQFALTSQAVW
ncbi:GNAT family N-acetyltransferase [Paraburkholderia phymatum]|uniref:GCN5-related N-acetyltransferase n=1 Tax=Paraburkholderia phymatum (strain DSM 17167 / CIP 108236 / LMG 21445 / STM815) TaxID=391038 RepID=B2JSS0_PARP8|nr:GNAT family N-acetyltransferase [Paraburkholderia phymatum]ACC75623.1 GCN5-related N-acetyltransferase [Paraburkholderia phymatum STM815]